MGCFPQALAGSDIGDLSFGSPISASALFIILLQQIIESNTLVRITVQTLMFNLSLFKLILKEVFVFLLQTWIHILVLVLSVASYFVFTLPFSAFCVVCGNPTNLFGVETHELSQPLFYIICALTTVTALLPR